jgi:hypothetical protein
VFFGAAMVSGVKLIDPDQFLNPCVTKDPLLRRERLRLPWLCPWSTPADLGCRRAHPQQ